MSDGAYLMDKIRSRCVEEGDCWLWQGACSAEGAPRLWHDGKSLPLRRVLWEALGKELKPGDRIGVKCRDPKCVAPDCLVRRTRSQELKGITRSIVFKAKVAAGKRARSEITPELIHLVRTSPLNNCELGRELNMNHQTVAKIRKNEIWRDYSSPWGQLEIRRASR